MQTEKEALKFGLLDPTPTPPWMVPTRPAETESSFVLAIQLLGAVSNRAKMDFHHHHRPLRSYLDITDPVFQDLLSRGKIRDTGNKISAIKLCLCSSLERNIKCCCWMEGKRATGSKSSQTQKHRIYL